MKKITKRAMGFLLNIAQNNNREWFLENKKEYLEIRKELEVFSAYWHSGLMKIDDSLSNIDCKPFLFRIYRDARFAKGKFYKQNYGILISRGGKGDMHNRAGYFLNIEPGNSFLVGGAYMPESKWLKSIRNNFINNSDEIKKILSSKNFKKNFELRGSKLKTAPRGFPKDHPEIEFLRYKDIYAFHYFSDEEILVDDFLENLLSKCKILYPFSRYLNKIENK